MPCTVTSPLLTQAAAVERLWEISTPPLRGEFTDAVMMRDYDRLASLWSPAGGRTWVAVRDVRTDAGFVPPVLAGERARDVFDHPYAYAARRGIPATALLRWRFLGQAGALT